MIAGKARQIAVTRAHEHLALDIEPSRRRAVKIAAFQRNGAADFRLQRLDLRLQRQLHAFGHEILDQERNLADRAGLGVGVDARAPGAGHGGCGQRQRYRAAAKPLIFELYTLVLDAVGAAHDQCHRHSLGRIQRLITHECGQMHGLAGLVDAALREHVRLQRPGRLAPGDAAIGQIEGRRGEIEERVIRALLFGHQQGRLRAALALGQARVEPRVTARVGFRGCQHLVVFRDQAHLDAALGLGRAERADEGMHAVGARERGQRQIGDDEPLRGAAALARDILVIAIVGFLGGFRDRRLGAQQIDAGFQFGQRLADRKRRRHILVQRILDAQIALPDALAFLGLDLRDLVTRGLSLIVARQHRAGQAPVTNAVDFDRDFIRVDADQRQSGLAFGGQHIRVAGDAHRFRPVAHIDADVDRLLQLLASHRRRQTRAQRQLVTLTVRQTIDADLAVLGGERLHVLAVQHQVFAEIGLPGGERFGELQAQSRRLRIRLDLVVEHAKAVLGAQRLIGGLDHGIVFDRQARLHRLDRRAPLRAALEGIAQHRQRLRFGWPRGRALVSDIGGATGVGWNVVALRAAFLERDRQQRTGKTKPGRRVPIIHHHGRGEVTRRRPVILGRCERLFASHPPFACRPVPIGIGLEERLVALCIAFGAWMHERLVLGLRRAGHNHRGKAWGQQQKRGYCETEQSRHGALDTG